MMMNIEYVMDMLIENSVVLLILSLSLLFMFCILFFKHRVKRNSVAFKAREKTLEKAFNLAKDAIAILSQKDEVIYVNKSMRTLLQVEKDTIDNLFDKKPQVKEKKEWIPLETFIQTHKIDSRKKELLFPKIKLKITRKEVRVVNLSLSSLPIENRKDEYYFIINIHDVTYMQKKEELPYHHKLTQLPNQLQLTMDMPKLFSKVHADNSKIALVLLTFDHFLKLRATIGYEESNKILVAFSNDLKNIVSTMDIKAYHTFDNYFLLTLSRVGSIEDVTLLISDIQKKLLDVTSANSKNLYLSLSAGIAVYPESGKINQIYDCAFKALDLAQQEGTGKVKVYLPKKTTHQYDALVLSSHIPKALENKEFEVYYQPIVEGKSKKVVGAEALIRWNHSEFGLISPEIFIGLMEETGYIVELGRFILEEVFKQQKRWELFKFKQIEVAINVSMVEIATGQFVQNIKKQLEHYKVNPALIKFEITESVAMGNEIQLDHYFHELRALGFSISLDDFGTGYTSFSYLKKFPANVLKIDKSLIDHIAESEDERRIVKGIIDLAHNLGYKIVVEGIETLEVSNIVTSYGAEYLQGYYFSKPLPLFEFQKLIR